MLSHEVRSPLNGAYGGVRLLEDTLKSIEASISVIVETNKIENKTI